MAVVLDGLAMKVGPAGSLHLQFSMILLVFLFYFLRSRVRIFAVPGAAFPFGFADLQFLASILLSILQLLVFLGASHTQLHTSLSL